MQGKKDYQEKLFIQFQLSDYVPQDNFYRQLKSIIDFSFLYASTAKYYGSEGQKSIDPIVFMKLMLVGYLENLNSDRRIISTSRMRMDILYFIGYDLDEELPWHSTLSRTRQLYGEEEFMALFKLVLKQCMDKGLISGKRQAVDSVFVKANASMSGLIERQILEDASSFSKELDANSEDDHDASGRNSTPKAPSKKKTSPDKVGKRSNQTHFSPSDPDARMSYKPGKVTKLNYLGQVSVDTASHVITHVQAFHADKGDAQCLPEVVRKTIENLAIGGLEVKEVLADTGYSSEVALSTLAANNIEGFIPNHSGYKENRNGFTYDPQNDRYTCAHGKYLTFRQFKQRGTNTHKIYKTKKADCQNCPFKSTCANSAGYKALEDSIQKTLYQQMNRRMKTDRGRKMRRLRSGTVEPVLGTLVNFMAMDKVYTKGISLANKCMIMAALAYNLKKLIRQPLKRTRKRRSIRFKTTCLNLSKQLSAYSAITKAITQNLKRLKSKWLNNHLLSKFDYSAI